MKNILLKTLIKHHLTIKEKNLGILTNIFNKIYLTLKYISTNIIITTIQLKYT